jgi:hypothetical protein
MAVTIDGTTGIDKVQDGSIVYADLDSNIPLGTKNIIINGDMRIAQRGNQTGVTAYQYINVDRYFINMINLGTWSFTQSTDVPTGQGFGKSLKIDCTTADASPAAGDNFYLSMQHEGQNIQHLKKGTSSAETTTLSFWIKSNKTGNYVVELWDRTNDRHIAVLKTISAANTWEKHICTFVGDTSGTIASDNARSIMISWAFDSGTNFTSGTLPTSWASRVDANRFVGTNLGLGDSTSNEVLLTGVQWELGENATPFENRSYGTELALCQRYFYKTNETNTTGCGGLNGSMYGTAALSFATNHPVVMRAAPTLTRGGTSDTMYVPNVDGAMSFTITTSNISANAAWFQAGGTGGGVGYPCHYRGQASWSAEL